MSAASVPTIAALLGITTNGRYPPQALTPQQRKERTFEALLRPSRRGNDTQAGCC